ncbi:alpha/beta-hydrolase [Lactarius akahatsu]|uniref:Alpha/beta-hydrolase n=1 Tax=Lactarius akahatsu TaxID=416441 RepID=A0AAD4LCI0_9AGAM|nr:alpha/beta-hydrolase [Lactarius akahatsu]
MSNLIPSLETFAKGTAATAAGLGTLGMGLLYYGQNFLIYPSAFPAGARENVPVPTDFSIPYTDLELTTPDDVKIKAFLLLQRTVLNLGETPVEWEEGPPSDEEVALADHRVWQTFQFAAMRPTVLMFHGNGGNHGHRIPLGKIFFGKMRCNVIMLSYRGYGHSEGTPSEKGLQIDAQTVLDYVRAHPILSKTRIILYGQSIGGAVSIDLAYRNPDAIAALVIENTFMSLPRLIPTAMPLLGPFSFLCHQKWESYLKAPKLPPDMRVLMLGGARDEVVPRSQMQELWAIIRSRGRARDAEKPAPLPASSTTEKARGKRANNDDDGDDGAKVPPRVVTDGGNTYIEFSAGTHNDTCIQPGYWSAVNEFVESLSPGKPSS